MAAHGVTTNGAALESLFRPPLQRSAVAYDLRGHGQSTWEPPWTLDQHVLDLLELVETVGGPVNLAGHSFGGLIALHAAVSKPEAFEALVLLDPALEVDRADAAQAAASSREWASWPSLEAARAGYRGLLDEDAAEEGMTWFDDNRVLLADGTVALPYNADAVASAWDDMTKPLPSLGGLVLPILLVLAQQGSMTSLHARQRLTDLGPQVRVEVVQTGHDCVWANPTLIRTLVAGFVDS